MASPDAAGRPRDGPSPVTREQAGQLGGEGAVASSRHDDGAVIATLDLEASRRDALSTSLTTSGASSDRATSARSGAAVPPYALETKFTPCGPTMRGPPFVRNIVLCELCERFTWYGLRAVIVLYFTEALGYGDDEAVSLYSFVSAIGYATPLIGGFVADSYLGKYRTLLGTLLVYLCGTAVLTLSSIGSGRGGSLVGLLLIALGMGPIKAVAGPFGADQFSTKQEAAAAARAGGASSRGGASSGASSGVSGSPDELDWAQSGSTSLIVGAEPGAHSGGRTASIGEAASFVGQSSAPPSERQRASSFGPAAHKPRASSIGGEIVFDAIMGEDGAASGGDGTRDDGAGGGGSGGGDNGGTNGGRGGSVALTAREKALTSFWAMWYLAINTGAAASYIATPWARVTLGFTAAFSMPFVLLAVAVAVLWYARGKYTMVPPSGQSVLSRMVRVLFTAVREWVAAKRSGRGTAHLESWIDHARGQYPSADIDAARDLWEILPVFGLLSVFWSCFDQQGSSWTLQAARMDTMGLPPEQMAFFNSLFVLTLIPVFDKVLYPRLEKLAERGGRWSYARPTPLRRIGAGMFLTAMAFFLAAAVESAMAAGPANSVNMMWQLPQYFVITAAELCVSVTGLEFAYSQAPPSLKSSLMALFMLTTTVGDVFTGVIYAVAGGGSGHQGSLFMVFSYVVLGTLVVFVFMARTYVYRDDRVRGGGGSGSGGSGEAAAASGSGSAAGAGLAGADGVGADGDDSYAAMQ